VNKHYTCVICWFFLLLPILVVKKLSNNSLKYSMALRDLWYLMFLVFIEYRKKLYSFHILNTGRVYKRF